MAEIYYADDGLRLSTPVRGPSYIESQWALQPNAGGLTALEATELGVARTAATLISDFWCGL